MNGGRCESADGLRIWSIDGRIWSIDGRALAADGARIRGSFAGVLERMSVE